MPAKEFLLGRPQDLGLNRNRNKMPLFSCSLLTTGPPSTYPYFGLLWWALIFPRDRYAAPPSLTLRSPFQPKPNPSQGPDVSLLWSPRFLVFAYFCLRSVAVSFHPLPLSFPSKGQTDTGVWESISKTSLLLFFPDCQKLSSRPFHDFLGSFVHIPTAVIVDAGTTWYKWTQFDDECLWVMGWQIVRSPV